LINKHQAQTNDRFNKKEDDYFHLKMANEEAQKELINLKNKLKDAQIEGILEKDTTTALTKNELKEKILLANEDLSLENPVD
jgi:hypothetical protein